MAATAAPAAAAPTRISEAGSKRRPQAGLSLIELLVVLLVMAASAGIAVLALPRSADPLEAAMADLNATLAGATDRAILTGRPVGLFVDEEGYRLAVLDRQEWMPLRRSGGAFVPGAETVAWPSSLDVAIDLGDAGFFAALPPEPEEGRLLIRARRPTEAPPEEEEEEPAPQPQIVLSATGAATPASIVLTADDRTGTLTLLPSGEAEVRYAAR